MSPASTQPALIDPIDAAVVRSGLASIAREMFGLFQRTAMLPHLYEARDFSFSVFDDRLNLVADASGVPEFVGSLTVAATEMLRVYDNGGALAPGDIIVANDPFFTGGHPADAALLAPAFDVRGQLVGYCGMRAHMGDMGALNSYPADARSVYDEGLIFPPLRLVCGGTVSEELLAIVAANSRLPRETVGNFRSAVATLGRGALKLVELVDRFGLRTYHAAVDQLLDAAEHRVRTFLAAIPDGAYAISERLELAPPESVDVELHCTVRIRGSELVVDVSESVGQQPGALNVPLPQTLAACRLALKRLTTQDDNAANGGEYRMLSVIAPLGSVFNAQRPAATYMMATTASLLSEMVVSALAPMLGANRIAQSGGHTTGFMSLVSDGPRGRQEIVDDLAPIGYGATPDADGLDSAMHFCLAGMGRASGEVLETRAHVIKRASELLPDSGGPGRWRGGLGTRTVWQFRVPATMTIQAQRIHALGGAGLEGGGVAGGRNDVRLDHGPTPSFLGMAGGVPLAEGDTVTLYGAGGGGFGDPLTREPERVAEDVRDGVVSRETAQRSYGVVLDVGAGVDAAATAALRRGMRPAEQVEATR